MSRARETGRTLTLFAEDSPARTSAAQGSAADSAVHAPASGTTSHASSGRSARRGSSSKTSRRVHAHGCQRCGVTCTCLDTIPPPSDCLPSTLGRLTFDAESSLLLPTLTATANMLAPSMQKWPSHRRLLPTLLASVDERGARPSKGKSGAALGRNLSPTWCEWFMGFPMDWTLLDDEPLGTPSSRNVQK